MKKLSIFFSILMILALTFTFKPAQAAEDPQWLQFSGCLYNNPVNGAIGEAQMWVKVEDLGTQVKFTFYNIGSQASSITDVYFDDGALLDMAVIDQPEGVNFTQGADPGDLPGGNNCLPPFEATVGFTADSEPPAEPNGVNQNPPYDEWVAITFILKENNTFADVINQLGSGELRIGIHVQGFPDGGSEAFINTPYTAVELMSFNASARNGNVIVRWTTGTELNNAGFNLYRSSSELAARTRINNTLIAARGDAVSGGSYSFTDAPGYGTFFYWLEDVELGGTATLNGPVVVTAWPSIRLPVSRPAVP